MNKAQEKQIQMLEEQNKSLKADLAHNTDIGFQMKHFAKLQQKQVDSLREENKKLADKMSKEILSTVARDVSLISLKQENTKLRKDRDYYKWIFHNNSKEYKKIIGQKKQEIQRLKDELKAFSKAATHNGQMGLASKAREDKLQEENEKLKKKNEELSSKIRTYLSLGPSQSVN